LLPEVVGEKVALNVALCPAGRVAGKLGPVKLNPVPVATAAEIVTATPPVFVTVTGNDGLLPIITFPNARLAGEAAISLPATPDPDRVNTEVGEAYLWSFPPLWLAASETIPLSVPA
jgi:hypothetical protein